MEKLRLSRVSSYEEVNGSSSLIDEQYIYGLSRIGVMKPINSVSGIHVIGQKQYELNDHLANVRVVLNDKMVNGNASVVAAIDYFPFGMMARSYSQTYRYGYNAQEKLDENEVKFWISSAKKEYFFVDDRNIKYLETA